MIHASRVGVHTHPDPGAVLYRCCPRCGLRRQVKASAPDVLCGSCAVVVRSLGETGVWQA